MSGRIDWFNVMNTSCGGGCDRDLGPPPDQILTIPPPPLPAFLYLQAPNLTRGSCSRNLCDVTHGQGVEFVELPHPVFGGTPGVDDTWLFVLISCSIGVLLLGSLLALILLKCREERSVKSLPPRVEVYKKSCEAVLYPGDSRVLWATLTPRGTTRHIAAPTFDNTAFSEAAAAAAAAAAGRPFHPPPPPDDYYMARLRPRVSSPTRIENPNLPPLNLHRSLRKGYEPQPPLL